MVPEPMTFAGGRPDSSERDVGQDVYWIGRDEDDAAGIVAHDFRNDF